MVVPLVGDTGRADVCREGRLHTDCEEEGAWDVPKLGVREGHLPIRRATEEIPPGAVRAAHASALT